MTAPAKIVNELVDSFPQDKALFGEGPMMERDVYHFITNKGRSHCRRAETAQAFVSGADLEVRWRNWKFVVYDLFIY